MMIRELMGFLPSNNQEEPPFHPTVDDPSRRERKLRDLVPDNPNRPYDMKELIGAVMDEGYFYEVQRNFAPNIVIGFARLGGRSVGVVANHRRTLPALISNRRLGTSGALHRVLRLLQRPDRHFVDVPGFLPERRRNSTASFATAPAPLRLLRGDGSKIT